MEAICSKQGCIQIKHPIKAHIGTIYHSHWWKMWVFESGFGNWADDSVFWWANMLNLVSNWDTQMAALLSSHTLTLTFYFTEFIDISPATTITSGFFEARCQIQYIELCLVHLKPYNWNQMRDTITGVKQLSWMQFVGWLEHPWGVGVGGYDKEGSHMKLCLDRSIIWVFYTLDGKVMCMHRGKKTLWSEV